MIRMLAIAGLILTLGSIPENAHAADIRPFEILCTRLGGETSGALIGPGVSAIQCVRLDGASWNDDELRTLGQLCESAYRSTWDRRLDIFECHNAHLN